MVGFSPIGGKGRLLSGDDPSSVVDTFVIRSVGIVKGHKKLKVPEVYEKRVPKMKVPKMKVPKMKVPKMKVDRLACVLLIHMTTTKYLFIT
jgi:hypothetical protein